MVSVLTFMPKSGFLWLKLPLYNRSRPLRPPPRQRQARPSSTFPPNLSVSVHARLSYREIKRPALTAKKTLLYGTPIPFKPLRSPRKVWFMGQIGLERELSFASPKYCKIIQLRLPFSSRTRWKWPTGEEERQRWKGWEGVWKGKLCPTTPEKGPA